MDTKEIKVIYYSGGTYSSFVLNHAERLKPADFLVFDFNILPRVSFEGEMEDSIKIFKDLAYLSKTISPYVIAAAEIENKNNKKPEHCVLVFESGQLLAICRPVLKEKGGSASVSFFDTSHGRIGVLAGSNAGQIEFYQLAAVYEANLVFAMAGGLKNSAKEKLNCSLCALYASEQYNVNVLCFFKKQLKAYCQKNKSFSGRRLSFSSHLLKKSPKNSKFFKHLYKIIYLKLS